ncbi:MAG TPA: ATP-dependent Clp protease ATP-binding subunit [Candidatus Saccharimonadales bacterium]|nr:ATP-dependent Clp protease ATP-binding subunit [Candidatus Saccharimonadales bacterium]
MGSQLINLASPRAQQARLGKAIGKNGFRVLLIVGTAALVGVLLLALRHERRWALVLTSAMLAAYLPAIWWKRQLSVLPPHGTDLSGQLAGSVLAGLKPGTALNPQTMWAAIQNHWQTRFFADHLLLSGEVVAGHMSTDQAELQNALQLAGHIAQRNKVSVIEPGFVMAGLLLASQSLRQRLTAMKAQESDIEAIADWIGRNLDESQLARHNFGGIGRDWAFGFTPLLNRFGQNVSQAIIHGASFGSLMDSDTVLAIETAFDNNAAAVVLVGPDGIGKSTSVYALAQRLIEGKAGRTLAYHQIIALNATDITSNARGPGELEHIMLSLANEAGRAGHVILFFDDAQLFLGGGPGSFDATQILLTVVQNRAVPIILAFTPNDYQRLRAQNQSLASLLTPVMLQELPEDGVMRVLEDATVGLEARHKVLIAYEALHEAYRLSGRYEQDEAYPGKAIKLLEQAVSHGVNGLVRASSVQEAIEQTRGVKVGTAEAAETDTLLHLEDKIHERMIDQSHAVQVVANALRRARAGVANPRRPIGSFLFLGPTGVGKTELAKAIAATYFGAESNMVRLDMSEYQQPESVDRLLSDGREEHQSLIMAVREQPFSVVLLDEIEKAHPNVLNLLLQLFDEGQLTDKSGKSVSFKDCIIIVTSNAGAQTIRERVQNGESLESFQSEFIDQLINSGQFKPELLNRFDEMVLFGPLKPEELAQVVGLMLGEINQTLANQNITVELTPPAIAAVVQAGYDPRLGARPMRRALQRGVEDAIAQKILRKEIAPGVHVLLDVGDLTLEAMPPPVAAPSPPANPPQQPPAAPLLQ